MAKQKSIQSKSLFGGFRKPEDIVTSALLHILEIGGTEMMNDLFDGLGLNVGFTVNTQVRGVRSRPDGELKAKYHLFIESKTEPWRRNHKHNMEQLKNHLELAEREKALLLYITIEDKEPSELSDHSSIYWTNWQSILADLKTYDAHFNREVIKYLVEQFEILLEDLVFSQNDMTNPEDRVLIVPGSFAESTALHFSFYKCQYGRTFRPCKYIAFYLKKRISHVYEIERGYELVQSLEDIKDFDFGMYVFDDDDKQPHTFMRLVNHKALPHDIVHNYPNAFTQNQRYTTIDKLLKASTTDDLL